MPLRLRITLIALAATVSALIAVYVAVWPSLLDRAIEQTRAGLLADARLVGHLVAEPLARRTPPDLIDSLVDATANELQTRVSIIAPDGRLVADSSISGAALLAAENHANRPEVRAAMATGSGTALRRSTTLDREMLFAAVVIRHHGTVVGVARAGRAMNAIDAQARELRRGIFVALLLAFVIALVLSSVLSASWVGSLHEMMQTARRLAAGDLSARVPVRRHDEIGELGRIVNQTADEHQRRLEEIARDRARSEAILGAMAEGVFAVDARGIVIMASQPFRRDFGVEAAVGRHYMEVVRQREIADILEAVLDHGQPQHAEVEVWPLRRVFAITAVPYPEAEGKAKGAVATFHDLTERRRIDQIRRDFVANASHELRTPLTSIRGFVEALEDGAMNDPATAARFLGKIRTHADRMTALMDDLLELSRLEAGHRPARYESVDLADLIDDVISSFAASASQKRQKLRAAGGDVASVTTDPDRLRRVLECLVENAVKYTPPGGEVRLTLREADGGAAIDVQDDGPGIPTEHLPRIFERFYRVDKARSRELGGTGLGLSIAKHLSEGMGASLSVKSEVGRGSCFTVALPARPAGPPA